MNINVDKNGIKYVLKLVLLFTVILWSTKFASRQMETMISPSPSVFQTTPPSGIIEEIEVDENQLYIELPSEKPVFLDKKTIFQKRDALSWEKKDFIFADLASMSLTLFKGGGIDKIFPILAKGKENGFMETPTGFYKIQAKLENHVSKIEKTKMPWSLYLFGNYFIHGWPILTNGKPAPKDFEGGSVRLSPENAKELFGLSQEGMAVLVYNDKQARETKFSYFKKTNLPHKVPETPAAAVLAADLETGEILFEKNKNDVFPTASVAKIMTAVVALENIKEGEIITIDDGTLTTYGNSAGFIKGETFKAVNLLYPLILPSSNDAAKAYELELSNFLELMNKKAAELGMTKTYFADSSGLDQNTASSAADLFKLVQYIYTEHPKILEISKLNEYGAYSENKKKKHAWTNINWPRGDKRFMGGKAGWTEDSLQTMAGIYALRMSEYGGRPMAIITLGARNRINDIKSIINYLEQEFIYGFVLTNESSRRPTPRSGASLHEAVR